MEFNRSLQEKHNKQWSTTWVGKDGGWVAEVLQPDVNKYDSTFSDRMINYKAGQIMYLDKGIKCGGRGQY